MEHNIENHSNTQSERPANSAPHRKRPNFKKTALSNNPTIRILHNNQTDKYKHHQL